MDRIYADLAPTLRCTLHPTLKITLVTWHCTLHSSPYVCGRESFLLSYEGGAGDGVLISSGLGAAEERRQRQDGEHTSIAVNSLL